MRSEYSYRKFTITSFEPAHENIGSVKGRAFNLGHDASRNYMLIGSAYYDVLGEIFDYLEDTRHPGSFRFHGYEIHNFRTSAWNALAIGKSVGLMRDRGGIFT